MLLIFWQPPCGASSRKCGKVAPPRATQKAERSHTIVSCPKYSGISRLVADISETALLTQLGSGVCIAAVEDDFLVSYSVTHRHGRLIPSILSTGLATRRNGLNCLVPKTSLRAHVAQG